MGHVGPYDANQGVDTRFGFCPLPALWSWAPRGGGGVIEILAEHNYVRVCVLLFYSRLKLGRWHPRLDEESIRSATTFFGGGDIIDDPRTAHLNEDHAGEPNVALLAKHVQSRLADLRMSTLAASKLGIVSRSTLHSLNKPGSRVPSFVTLAKFDELLSWVPGSAHASLYGKEPVTREYAQANPASAVDDGVLDSIYFEMVNDDQSTYHYTELKRLVTIRLGELGLSQQRFAAIGGPGRSTMATLGNRGYAPSAETMHRIDKFCSWEPGSTLAVLRGGMPTTRGIPMTPHRAIGPLNAAYDLLMQSKARLRRQDQATKQLLTDVDRVMSQLGVVITDLEDPQRYLPGSGTQSTEDGDVGQEEGESS